MFKYRLKRKNKLSRKQSESLILMMAQYGDNQMNMSRTAPLTDQTDVVKLFEANGYAFESLIEECRDPEATVPLVENMLQVGTMILESDEGAEQIVTSNYEAAFDIALAHLDRSIEDCSFAEVESAIVRGIASIEAFINHRVNRWNADHSDKELLDSKQNKVSFDDKIDTWLPIITGNAINKGTRHWNDFKRLRGVRDNLTVHAKLDTHTVKYHELADLINAFRTGVVGLLVDLHLLSRHWLPSAIVRAYHLPDVEVVEIDAENEFS